MLEAQLGAELHPFRMSMMIAHEYNGDEGKEEDEDANDSCHHPSHHSHDKEDDHDNRSHGYSDGGGQKECDDTGCQ